MKSFEQRARRQQIEDFVMMAPPPPDELRPENDPGDLDSDYTPLQHLQAKLKTEDQLAKKAGKKNG